MSNRLITFLLAAAFAGSAAYNVSQHRNAARDKARIEVLSIATGKGEALIITKYLHDSIEHVVVREVAVKGTPEKAIAVGSGYLDTLTNALNVAVKQVDEVTKVNGKLMAENLQLKRQGNSTSKYQYRDKYLSLDYDHDSNTVALNYDVSLNVAKYWKRSWLLAPKREFIDIFSDDKRVSIGSVKRFTIAPAAKKRLGVGVSAGYGYLPTQNKWQPYIGLAFNYNLIEF